MKPIEPQETTLNYAFLELNDVTSHIFPVICCCSITWNLYCALKACWLHDAPTGLTFNNYMLCLHCFYVLCIYLRTKSNLCHLQHKLIGFYNRDEKCLLHGTDWLFKWSSLPFIIKGLNTTCHPSQADQRQRDRQEKIWKLEGFILYIILRVLTHLPKIVSIFFMNLLQRHVS
jgi:hypothetical protein